MTFGFLEIILGLIALGAMVGVYVINKKQSPQGQTISLILLLVFIVAGGAFLWTSNILSVIGIGKTEREVLREANQQFYASQAFVIGNKIESGKKVLVIVDDSDQRSVDTNKPTNITAFLEVLQETPAGANVTIDSPELSALKNLTEEQKIASRATVGFNMIVTPNDYNELIEKHNPDVIIIAAGLPQNSPAGIRILRKNNKTPVYITTKSGVKREIAEQLVNGKYVSGIVLRNNKSQKDVQPSADLQASFDQLYEYIGE